LTPAEAQKQWTLRECCDYAVSHNISVKQQENQLQQRELQLETARASRLPDLSASAGQNFSFGRGLTAQNTYENTNTSSTSLSLGTSVPLFTGFQIPNQIKLNQLNLEAATADLEKAKNDIRTQVAQAYVQILYNMEISDVARRQISIDSMQVARIQSLVDNGKASGAELSQQQATLAQSQLTATQADNNLQIAILNLTQLLELPTPAGFSVVRPTTTTVPTASAVGPDAFFAEALTGKPEVQSAQIGVTAAERNIDIAKAGYYPTLSLSGGMGTNYYTTSGFMNDGFGKQLKNNFSQYIGLNLSVPIFNRFQTRNSVRSARIDRENQLLQLDNTKKTLYKEIQQVYYNAVAADAKYASSTVAAQSSHDAFTLMQAKYENGKANITEFNESKNNYLRAESDLVQARYEQLYQHALLQFYRGKELNF
jgi:outer membrane protein